MMFLLLYNRWGNLQRFIEATLLTHPIITIIVIIIIIIILKNSKKN